MIKNEHRPREERAQMRRLGEWGPPDVSSVMANHPSNGVPDPEVDIHTEIKSERLRFNPATLALLFLLLGALILGTGITIAIGIGWGVTTLGLAIFIVGFMMALEPSDTKTTET